MPNRRLRRPSVGDSMWSQDETIKDRHNSIAGSEIVYLVVCPVVRKSLV